MLYVFINPYLGFLLVFIRKLPLPLRERVGVRGMRMAGLEILELNHPHPHPPPSRGRGKIRRRAFSCGIRGSC